MILMKRKENNQYRTSKQDNQQREILENKNKRLILIIIKIQTKVTQITIIIIINQKVKEQKKEIKIRK